MRRGVSSQRSSFWVLSGHYKGKERISESRTDIQMSVPRRRRKAIRYLLWELTETRDLESTLELIILVDKLKSEPLPKVTIQYGLKVRWGSWKEALEVLSKYIAFPFPTCT